MMKKIIMMLFMIVCFSTISNAKETEKLKENERYLVDINDFISQEDFTEDLVTANVNIRTTPNMDDNIYAVVEKNDKLLVKNTRNGWTEVYYDEYVFYVDTSYLKETNTQSKEQVEETKEVVEEKIEPKVDIRVDNGYKYYSIFDCYPDENLEKYLYQQLTNRGIAWYYPYAVAQIYQESNWNPTSTNGRDHGLCQFKGIYWDDRAALAGLPGADIWNPYDSLYVYAWFMAGLLNGRSVDWALSLYITGVEGQYHSEYVNYVYRWYNSLR